MRITISTRLKLILFILVLLASGVLALQFGSTFIPLGAVLEQSRHLAHPAGLFDIKDTILWDIRLPRILFAAVAGAGISLTGLLMQTVTRNSLADPYILGVSSGASTGAVFAIIMGGLGVLGAYNVPVFAFGGAMLAILLVIGAVGRSSSPIKLVLIGMGMSALFSAITMMIIYSAKHEAQVRSAMFWLLGSFSGLQWRDLPFATAVILITLIVTWLVRHDLDILLLGENEARQMGLTVKRFQLMIVMLASVSIAVVVGKIGVVGFIGLITPHLARMAVGPRHEDTILFTGVIGAIVMIWADVLSRSMYAPEEVPICVLTSLLGAPLFIWILVKHYEA